MPITRQPVIAADTSAAIDAHADNITRELARHIRRAARAMVTLERLAAQGAAIELQAISARPRISYGGACFTLEGPGCYDWFRQRHTCPTGWPDAGVPWHPSHWRRTRSRVDQHGATWTDDGDSIYVQDDFGTLVPVEVVA